MFEGRFLYQLDVTQITDPNSPQHGGGGGYGGDPNINISSISIWDSELTKAELQSYRFSDLTGNENNIKIKTELDNLKNYMIIIK